ncbi:MAG: DUF1801 domain-containing protein [Bacteroidota bacterium]
MSAKDPSKEITNYIKDLDEPARSICTKLRAIILKAVPDIKEDWKWGPNYNYNGMVCGVGRFQKTCSTAFLQRQRNERRPQALQLRDGK